MSVHEKTKIIEPPKPNATKYTMTTYRYQVRIPIEWANAIRDRGISLASYIYASMHQQMLRDGYISSNGEVVKPESKIFIQPEYKK